MVTENEVMDRLEEVVDPEFDINIVDLGLIYEVEVDDEDNVDILMTLTTKGCPFHGVFREVITEELEEMEEVEGIDIELTFEPKWDPDMMTDKARQKFGKVPGRHVF